MRKHPNKLGAFTIMEIVIVMMIVAILVGIAFTAYTIVSKSYLGFTGKNKAMGSAVLLDKLLKNDFFKADLISGDSHHILFHTDSSEVSYAFNPDFITRTQGITDTFKLQTTTITAAFENHPLNDMAPEIGPNPLDDLVLTVMLQNEKIPYHYHKLYSSVNLFNPHADANH